MFFLPAPKIQHHTNAGVGSFHQPQRCFAHVHINIVGPSCTPKDIITYSQCSTTRQDGPKSSPMIEASAAADRGATFMPQLWVSLNCLLSTQLHHTTGYHPESSGMVERLHCTLKAALMSHCNSSAFYSQLPWVLLGLQTTPKELP
ncbi:uncharacterized protein [Macrobrachium rosenbergii]|uniref:uncharacterized protein n=1 Tax=Macrobrachium rosenbergii TaxID=79674 RepID=UPI0034D5F28B